MELSINRQIIHIKSDIIELYSYTLMQHKIKGKVMISKSVKI